MAVLARVLQAALGPSGARVLSMAKGNVKSRDLADVIENARLCLWLGADTAKTTPVWEVNALTDDFGARRPGNVVLLVSDWPEGWDSLDHLIAHKFGWAWRVQGTLAELGIDPDSLLDEDAQQFLVSMLVEGAIGALAQFQATKLETGVGDPSQVAATEYSAVCAEEMRVAGGNRLHRALYAALRYTGDARDIMTLADVDDALRSAGEETIPHHVVGKAIPKMWRQVDSRREQIDGAQTRVIRRVAPRIPTETL